MINHYINKNFIKLLTLLCSDKNTSHFFVLSSQTQGSLHYGSYVLAQALLSKVDIKPDVLPSC